MTGRSICKIPGHKWSKWDKQACLRFVISVVQCRPRTKQVSPPTCFPHHLREESFEQIQDFNISNKMCLINQNWIITSFIPGTSHSSTKTEFMLIEKLWILSCPNLPIKTPWHPSLSHQAVPKKYRNVYSQRPPNLTFKTGFLEGGGRSTSQCSGLWDQSLRITSTKKY